MNLHPDAIYITNNYIIIFLKEKNMRPPDQVLQDSRTRARAVFEFTFRKYYLFAGTLLYFLYEIS